jgi:hypothetical protein
MLAEDHLIKFGVTVQQASEFIVANVEQPETLFYAALDSGVTTEMLSEITSNSSDVICDYFSSAGFDCGGLDDTSILLNSDTSALENLVGFNKNIGALSNDLLSENVQTQLFTPDILHFFWSEANASQKIDGIYDAAELGVEHLNNIPASNENIESLFYGTLINVFSALDESELTQINEFPDNGNTEDFQTLFLDALNDIPEPVVWNEEAMFKLVANEASVIMNGFFVEGGVDFVGRLDPLLSPSFWG